jgi:glutamine synthetase
MSTEYRNFLALSYSELEDLNLAAKADRAARVSPDEIREKRIKYLTDEKRIKAVTVLFSDLEGRLHLLDYDKKFLLGAYENLTFDGSSIRGFTAQHESDLRLGIDWGAFYWVPADVFGAGKVLVFGTVIDKDGSPYSGDLRGVLKVYADKLYTEKNYTLNAANEIEGFLFAGKDAEQRFHETGKFEFINTGGYYHALPLDPLRQFIDFSAEVQRAMGFQNEKDHQEVAPSQFEINYGYGEVVAAADQIQLYKLLTRQIANSMGCTACYLPKPVVGVNGSGMHTNVSISDGKTNLFWDPAGLEQALPIRLGLHRPHPLQRARSLPHHESQRQLLSPPRSPLRSPQSNQGLRHRSRLHDPHPHRQLPLHARRGPLRRPRRQPLPHPLLHLQNRHRRHHSRDRQPPPGPSLSARQHPVSHQDFKASPWITEILGADVQGRFADLKQAAADRSPRELGAFVKGSEVQYHHEVYNQAFWNHF